MRTTLAILLCLAFMASAAYAAQGPEIDVVDGKISISAQAVPLGRLMSLLDRTMGFTSEVKPELANRSINVRFTSLEIKDAVQKIFEGQPLNYMFIEGKGIRVTELAQSGAATSTSTPSSSFPSSPSPNSQPTISNQPQSAPAPGQPVPINTAQPAQGNSPFGNPPNPNATAAPATNPGAPTPPGQLPPPIGTTNPLVTPVGGAPAGGGFPGGAPAPAPQPSGPGTLPGVTPGVIGR